MESDERLQVEIDSKELEAAGNTLGQLDEDAVKSTNSTDDQNHEADQLSENGQKRKRTPPPDGMSRSAYKKLKRNQEWEAGRAERRTKRKDKEREKRVARKAAIAAGEALPPPPKPSRERSALVPVTFVIDCAFDDLMTDTELKSLASQITRCYSDNSKAKYRAHLAVSSFNGKLRQRFDTVLGKQYKAWKGTAFYDEDFVEAAGKAKEKMSDDKTGGKVEGALIDEEAQSEVSPEQGEVIYLSSESEHTIERLSPYSTYIIGGLVDRNRHKGICYKRACDRGIKTAKLPIGEFMEMNSRYVLATNHVNEIMLHWLEKGDWGEAFMHVMPKRKGGVLKGEKNEEESHQAEDVEDEGEMEERPGGEAEGKAEVATGETEQGVVDGDAG